MQRLLLLAALLLVPAAHADVDDLDPLEPSPQDCLQSGRPDAPLHCIPLWSTWVCDHAGVSCPTLPVQR